MELNDKVEPIEYVDPNSGEESTIPFYDAVSHFVNDLYYVEG